MSKIMKAKMIICSVVASGEGSEELTFAAVGKDGAYDQDGSDENNTFSSFTPVADLTMVVNNPALVGQFKEGDAYYLDFTKAGESPEVAPAPDTEEAETKAAEAE